MLLAVAGSEKETIKANETAAWQAYKDKNADAFKKVVDKDIRCVYSDGVSNFQKEMDNMKKWAVKSFTIGDFDSFSDEKDVIVTTYTVKLDATADGKDISGTYNAGSVWKKEGNDWLAIFHTNMKQESATK
jgi:ketosteroid isomerase-like protein